jgi:hypothetical protein
VVVAAIAILMPSACEGKLVILGRSASDAVPAAGSAGGASTLNGGGGGAAGAAGVGQSGIVEPRFADVRPVASLASTYNDDNPTLTANLLELYFSSKDRPGGKGKLDVWVAKRKSVTDSFGTPSPVSSVSTDGNDNSPAISADGSTLWVGYQPASGGLGGNDIMQATRASLQDDFGTPVLVSELSSDADDIPRPPGNHDLTMPLGSRRDSTIYLTYLADRATPTSTFGAPVLHDELIVQGSNVADAFLTDDGTTLYFARSSNDIGDIYVAYRPTPDSAFGTAVPLSTVNTDADDRDPWLSPDGTKLFFTSNRQDGKTLQIFEATRVPE